MKDNYEILLLEIRQGVKEAEENLKHLVCVDLIFYRRVKHAKNVVHQELINYRIGHSEKNKDIIKLMEG